MKTNEKSNAVIAAILSMEEVNDPVKLDQGFKPSRLTVLVLSQIIDNALEKGNEEVSDFLLYAPGQKEELKKLSDYLLEKAKYKNLAENLKNLK